MQSQSTEQGGYSFRSYIPRLFRRSKAGFSRQFMRHDCVVLGTMRVIDIGAEFDGVIGEISCGGCTFRPTSKYLLDRSNEAVLIRTEYFQAEGRIRSSRTDGYGVQFFERLDLDVVERMVEEQGGKIVDSFLGKRGGR
jgi:hypothetical protein